MSRASRDSGDDPFQGERVALRPTQLGICRWLLMRPVSRAAHTLVSSVLMGRRTTRR